MEDNVVYADVLMNDGLLKDGDIEDAHIHHVSEPNEQNFTNFSEAGVTEPSTTTVRAIRELMEDAIFEATAGGDVLLHHLQSMMTTVASDIRRIQTLKENDICHPQAAFEIVYTQDGNSVARKKDF
jgi:hypothetical protein